MGLSFADEVARKSLPIRREYTPRIVEPTACIIDVFNGGSLAGTIAATETAIVLAGPNTKVIPGHGDGFTDRDGLIEVLDMMVDIRDTIPEMIFAPSPFADYFSCIVSPRQVPMK